MKASSRKPLCEEQNDKTVDSFGRHESDGDLPVQTVNPKDLPSILFCYFRSWWKSSYVFSLVFFFQFCDVAEVKII
jgi:hypothetical protein